MVTLSNKYALIAEATSRFKAFRQPYEVWLEYQNSLGYVFVKTGYLYHAEAPTFFCILTRPMSVNQWCIIANSLRVQGYKPVLLNCQDLIQHGN